ncbi:hypothetical protein WA026_017526 [Henosepilachna vigintioctopunctata]|uniref:C2H2-type domain-containing protein n=1 Tax=Henosepilachna vigintioctopunctata TaxID=420089 RepID=A0AAW1V404_9CUCU
MNSAQNNFCIICKTIPVSEINGKDENANTSSMFCEKCSHELNDVTRKFEKKQSDIEEKQSGSRDTHNKILVREEMEIDPVLFIAALGLRRVSDIQNLKKEPSYPENARNFQTIQPKVLDMDNKLGKNRTFQCPECCKNYSSNSNLRRHFRTHVKTVSRDEENTAKNTQKSLVREEITTDPLFANVDIDNKLKQSKSFQCPKCEKNFYSNYNMRRHYKTHVETVSTDDGNKENTAKNTHNKIYVVKRNETDRDISDISEFAEAQNDAKKLEMSSRSTLPTTDQDIHASEFQNLKRKRCTSQGENYFGTVKKQKTNIDKPEKDRTEECPTCSKILRIDSEKQPNIGEKQSEGRYTQNESHVTEETGTDELVFCDQEGRAKITANLCLVPLTEFQTSEINPRSSRNDYNSLTSNNEQNQEIEVRESKPHKCPE